jgi:hypothetical protein
MAATKSRFFASPKRLAKVRSSAHHQTAQREKGRSNVQVPLFSWLKARRAAVSWRVGRGCTPINRVISSICEWEMPTNQTTTQTPAPFASLLPSLLPHIEDDPFVSKERGPHFNSGMSFKTTMLHQDVSNCFQDAFGHSYSVTEWEGMVSLG